MYQKEFDNRIRQNLEKAVLLYGDNDYMIEHYIDLYKIRLDAKDSMLKLYYDDWDFQRAKSYLSQSSLFGGTNFLLIRQDKKIPKKELDQLVELVNKNADSYLLFAFFGEQKDTKSLTGSFSEKKGGVAVRFFEANIGEGVSILQQKAQKIGLNIDHYALQHLMTLLNNNLALCSNELDKLAILETTVTSKDIDILVYSTAPLAIEQLIMDLFDKKDITHTLSRLLEVGESESEILRRTQYFVNEIFLINAYIKMHGTPDFREILGFNPPPQIKEKKQRLALKVKSVTLLKIFEHLLESELLIKNATGVQKEALLYSTLIKLQSYI